ncbi:MAG: hypothetical protein P4N60_08010 [Verrucomicrobiae bacterium]|nr:hypothetical protein [Verrucomicrobiae bacterium]
MDAPVKEQPKIPFGVFFAVFMVVFTLVFGFCAISTELMPKSYASDARIEVGTKSAGENGRPAATGYNLAKTEAGFITSELLLRKVISELDLNQRWGQKYFSGETLKTWETLKILQGRIGVYPVSDTLFIRIIVYDDNPQEAAVTANAIANAYVNYTSTNLGNVQAQIVDAAYPVKRPIKPNVALDMILGAMFGGILAAAAGVAGAGFVYVKNRNKLRLTSAR